MGAQEDYNMLSELADRMQVDDKEREGMIADGMKRLGHVARSVWEDAKPDDSSGSTSMFGSRKAASGGSGRSNFQYPNG